MYVGYSAVITLDSDLLGLLMQLARQLYISATHFIHYALKNTLFHVFNPDLKIYFSPTHVCESLC